MKKMVCILGLFFLVSNLVAAEKPQPKTSHKGRNAAIAVGAAAIAAALLLKKGAEEQPRQPKNSFGPQGQRVENDRRPYQQSQRQPTRSASGSSAMLVDDLAQRAQQVSNLTPITIGKPMPFEEMRGYYNGYQHFAFGAGFPGSTYPQYSSLQPARELPAYVQQELFEEYQRAGQFNPLIPGTGHMSQHLGVMAEELRIGKGILVDSNGKEAKVRIGPEDWTTTRYVVVSSVGIIEEELKGRELRGDEIVRIIDSLGLDKTRRGSRILHETLGQARQAEADRRIVGILYVAIVDIQTRSVVKSSTGVAAVSYKEFAATDVPGSHTTKFRYMGAGRFARELVLAALRGCPKRSISCGLSEN